MLKYDADHQKFWDWMKAVTGFSAYTWIHKHRENWEINLIGYMMKYTIEILGANVPGNEITGKSIDDVVKILWEFIGE